MRFDKGSRVTVARSGCLQYIFKDIFTVGSWAEQRKTPTTGLTQECSVTASYQPTRLIWPCLGT